MTAVDHWWETLSPFTVLGGAAGKVAADAWTSVMLSLWAAGLWLLRLVLGLVDAFLTPDLREGGPAAGVYRTTFWVAATLVLFMAMLQFGVAAFRRDGQSLARVAVGTAQFLMVWVAWLTYAVAVLAACGGLTRAVMKATMGVDAWSQWQPWAGFSTKDIGDAAVATVLGVLGVILVFAAIGHLLVMLTRAGALVVLAATTPIAAAGLVSDAGRSWFWKSLRWFHAAAFTPVLMALVMGVGIQLTTGVVVGTADGVAKAVGTAVPGVLLILIGCFTPLALFRMLAFVDPATSSGAAMRAGLAAQGGIQGLLSGGPATSATTGAAASTDGNGRSAGEDASDAATTTRITAGGTSLMKALGPVGQGVAGGLGLAQNLSARAGAVGADLANQMGVGHPAYVPDTATTSQGGSGTGAHPATRGDDATTSADPAGDAGGGAGGASGGGGSGSAPAVAPAPAASFPPPSGGGPGLAPAAGGGGAAAGGAAAAAAVPVVPV